MKQEENFDNLGLSQESLNAVEKMGFTIASPIQSEAIPKLLEGRDLIGQAQTGTGKTAAFGIPLLESIEESDQSLRGLVLCPTRELAIQVSKELIRLTGERKYIRVLAVFGGDPIYKQIKAVKDGVQIIVGTPGRLMDLMERKILNLDTVKMAIMDEADEMLNMGFRDDMEAILSTIPKTRQTVLFSATMSPPIMDIASRYLRNPAHIKVTGKEVTNSRIEQCYVEVPHGEKARLVSSLARHYGMKSAIVFCNTKKAADETVRSLRQAGLKSDAIHGDLNQSQRNQVLTSFRNGQLGVLVATDVAARGIDVSDVDAVFNYDIPGDRESYVHRIGRTGRAGKEGRAISLVSTSSDLRKIRTVEKFSQVKMVKIEAPSSKDIRQSYVEQMGKIAANISGNEDYKHHRKLVEEIVESGVSAEELLAYFMKSACPLDVVDSKIAIREPYEESRGRSSGGRGGSGGSQKYGNRSSGGSGGYNRSSSGGSGSGGSRTSFKKSAPKRKIKIKA
ncbi:MAG: DEAD/DEAH box helicase [Leptospira sp.]|nr:DEAD/DEAH box helicase [Leptospira sp.]